MKRVVRDLALREAEAAQSFEQCMIPSGSSCGLLYHGLRARYWAMELISGFSFGDSASAALPPSRSPFRPSAPAKLKGIHHTCGAAARAVRAPLRCGPEAADGSAGTADRVRLGKTGFANRPDGFGSWGTTGNTGVLSGWVGAYNKKVGAGLDAAMASPGRQQCDIARGHLHLLSSRSGPIAIVPSLPQSPAPHAQPDDNDEIRARRCATAAASHCLETAFQSPMPFPPGWPAATRPDIVRREGGGCSGPSRSAQAAGSQVS
jgi:hypothetical protein